LFEHGALKIFEAPQVWHEVMRLVLDIPDLANFARVAWRKTADIKLGYQMAFYHIFPI
jgi:hypothetical protein